MILSGIFAENSQGGVLEEMKTGKEYVKVVRKDKGKKCQ